MPAVGVVLGDGAHLDGRAADAAQLPAGEHQGCEDKRSIVGASRKANVGARKLSSLSTTDIRLPVVSLDAHREGRGASWALCWRWFRKWVVRLSRVRQQYSTLCIPTGARPYPQPATIVVDIPFFLPAFAALLHSIIQDK